MWIWLSRVQIPLATPTMAVAWRVDELATRKGWNARELASRAGVDVKTARNILTGQATRVDLETIGRLADALGVRPGALFALAISWLRRAWGLEMRSTPRMQCKPDATGSSAHILTLTSWRRCLASARLDLTPTGTDDRVSVGGVAAELANVFAERPATPS